MARGPPLRRGIIPHKATDGTRSAASARHHSAQGHRWHAVRRFGAASFRTRPQMARGPPLRRGIIPHKATDGTRSAASARHPYAKATDGTRSAFKTALDPTHHQPRASEVSGSDLRRACRPLWTHPAPLSLEETE